MYEILFIFLISLTRSLLVKDPFDVSPYKFEEICSNLLEKEGYKTKWKKGKFIKQHQIDIEARKGLFNKSYFIECKKWSNPIGMKELRDFYGKIDDESGLMNKKHGIFITSSYFTKPAKEYAKKKNIELIDGKKLRKMLEKRNFIKSKRTVFIETFIILFVLYYFIHRLLVA